jgi:hypothetical protein
MVSQAISMPVFGSNAAQHPANVVTIADRMATNLQAQNGKPLFKLTHNLNRQSRAVVFPASLLDNQQ